MLSFLFTSTPLYLHALRIPLLRSTNRPFHRATITTTVSATTISTSTSTTISNSLLPSSSSLGLTDMAQTSESSRTGWKPSYPPVDSNWKERIDASIAKSRKIRGSNFVQIATVDLVTMEPKCRTVVFRGFQTLPIDHPMARPLKYTNNNNNNINTSCIMKMITDQRSSKVQESTACEMVWWFPKSNEQYRIRGTLVFVGPTGTTTTTTPTSTTQTPTLDIEQNAVLASARIQQWGNLSESAREQFYWDHPGKDYNAATASSNAVAIPTGGRNEEGTLLPPPDTFLLMLLLPHSVDYLRLGDNCRLVDQLTIGVWHSKQVNP